MGLFKKKPDPISDRARALKEEIAALESQIEDLHAKAKSGPRLRSTVVPSVQDTPSPASNGHASDPVFEPIGGRMKAPAEGVDGLDLYNDLGVRKFDLVSAWRKMQSHFRGPTANNPKLVSYLAAGSIKGLRPLRYEKRIARNRCIALFVILFLVAWGVAATFLRNHL